jgi:hypothetical protein
VSPFEDDRVRRPAGPPARPRLVAAEGIGAKVAPRSHAYEIAHLHDLHEAGALTDAEFDHAKKLALGS